MASRRLAKKISLPCRGTRQEDFFTVYVWCFLSLFSFLLFCSWNIFTLQCTSLSSTRFLQAVGHLTSAAELKPQVIQTSESMNRLHKNCYYI